MIVLISPNGSLYNIGLRTLCACLLQAGHNTRMIFLPSAKEASSFLLFDPNELYGGSIVDEVVELCSDATLIGITVMTNHFEKAKQLTEAFKQRLDVPVIWGGIHPTIRPEECLEHADFVCVGEGELPLVELADCLSTGGTYNGIGNLGYKLTDGRTVVNPLTSLIQDLDALPFPSFGPDNHYILHQGQVQSLTPDLLRFYLMDFSATDKPVYPLVTSRGCPHRCSYCANDSYGKIYSDWHRVRRRSSTSLLAEIEAARAEFPSIQEIAFLDDVFVAAPTRTIVEFSRQYQESVALPFTCIVSPMTINERKLEALLDAGLIRIGMGIETGSRRIQDLYNRAMNNDDILKAALLIHKHADRMLPPIYDVITDNPYEEIQDQLDTLELLRRIPPPYRLLMFSLVFYPGTGLYEHALVDGLIGDETKEIYGRNYFELQATYYNLVIYGFHRRFPRCVLSVMSHPFAFRLLSAAILAPFWRVAGWLLMRARIHYSKLRLGRFRRGISKNSSSS